MASQTLNQKQQSITLIAAFTAKGDMNALKLALNEGLDRGLTISELKEVVVQMYAYAGFPRALNALDAMMSVLGEREQKRIKDIVGIEAASLPSDKSRLELGTQIQTQLVGAAVKGTIYDFAPVIDVFLKEHLFGDIFGRGVLDFQSREIATIAALASLEGVENQLRAHLGIGRNVGLSETQEVQILALVKSTAAKEEGIFPKGDKGSADRFTGTVWVQPLVNPNEMENLYSVGSVTFEASGRTHWHTHPIGQTLLVLEGKGWYQERGKSARALAKGSVVAVAKDVEHWHGAAKESALTHIAITNIDNGSAVTWLKPVTPTEYAELENQRR